MLKNRKALWGVIMAEEEVFVEEKESCIGYLAQPLKTRRTGPPRSLSSLVTEPNGGTAKTVLLTGWREEDSIRQAERRRSGSMRSWKPS